MEFAERQADRKIAKFLVVIEADARMPNCSEASQQPLLETHESLFLAIWCN